MIWGRASGAAAVLLAASILMVPGLFIGHIIGHSSFLNVVWSEGFAARLFAGDLYPRWLPEMSQGAGSPVFYFYGPLPFYLIAPFHLVADPGFAIMLGCWLVLILSGLSFLALARAFVAPGPAIAAAVAYMAMPYHLTDVWIRAALGEQAAMIFIPLCLLCAIRLDAGRGYTLGLAASFACLLLSHLPSALVFSPFLVGFCLWTAWGGNRVAVLLRASFAALLAVGLAVAYVVPALLLQGMMQPDFWGNYRPEKFFLFGGNDRAFNKFLEIAFALMGAVFTLAAAMMVADGRGRQVAPWIAVAAGVAFLVTPLSAVAWELSPLLDRVQFPWRALAVFDVAACMLLALVLDARTRWASIVAWLMAVTMLFITAQAFTGEEPVVLSRPAAREEARIAARADAAEYLPSCRPVTATDIIIDGTSQQLVERALTDRGDDVLPVLYYPFLSVLADGVEVPAQCDPSTGFIRANVPEGAVVKIRKTTLPVERAAYAVSALSLMLLAGGLLWGRSGEHLPSAAERA
jgi:hypothetical protein